MTDDQARARLKELLGSWEYAFAMGHGCSLGWHPSSDSVRREVAELRAQLYGDKS
jgi:hypothetical protein